MYLLDTNVISEMRKIPKGSANPSLEKWVKETPPHRLYLCQIVVMELYKGLYLLERKDPIQAQRLRYWCDGVLANFCGRVLEITTATSQICAKFHTPNPRPINDTWIAAIAHSHNMTLVTRNVKDFDGLPIRLFNPFD